MDSIRAMTWNVWWRFGGHWQDRERGLVETVRSVAPDVLGLQECWGSSHGTQVDALAAELGYHAAFVETELPRVPGAGHEESGSGASMGVGLLSRWPIRSVADRELVSGEGRRCALVASIGTPRGELRVVVGTITGAPDRVEEAAVQFAELQRLTRDGHSLRPNPSILLADLNYDTTQPALAGMQLMDAWRAAEKDADPRTFSSANRFASPGHQDQAERQVDHVFYLPGAEGAVATAAWIVRDEPNGMPPSDHYPLVADIAVGVGPRPDLEPRHSNSWTL